MRNLTLASVLLAGSVIFTAGIQAQQKRLAIQDNDIALPVSEGGIIQPIPESQPTPYNDIQIFDPADLIIVQTSDKDDSSSSAETGLVSVYVPVPVGPVPVGPVPVGPVPVGPVPVGPVPVGPVPVGPAPVGSAPAPSPSPEPGEPETDEDETRRTPPIVVEQAVESRSSFSNRRRGAGSTADRRTRATFTKRSVRSSSRRSNRTSRVISLRK